MADIKKIFGKNVRIYRENSGISQERLAQTCGLHRTYIGSIERGERNISLENIQKIAAALHVKIIDLFEGINAKKSRQ
jgi:transcriptional regulator with XRE-family HTH domain